MDRTTTGELVVTHRSRVTEEQIDHLGHMNVRFYGVNAAAGTRALLGMLGASDERGRVVDLYTRHHREQLLGAALAVRSGVVDVLPDGLRLYHELVDEETGVLAATFVHRVRIDGDETNGPSPAVAAAARARLVTIPPHGATRTISLATDPVASAPGLEVLRTRDLAIRKVRAVGPEECSPAGDLLPTMAAGLVWAGEPVDDRFPALLHEGPNGERMGWASMETRMAIRRFPRVGDRIQSFSAVVGLGDKILHNVMWAYDVDVEDLLVTFEVVNLAFDVNGRKPMRIPDAIRAAQSASLHPDLAPGSGGSTSD
ncbi:MAG: thioesterase family protein [Acidimicrobiia bacterium]